MFGCFPLCIISESLLRTVEGNASFFMYFLSLILWLPSSWDALQDDECGCLQLLLQSVVERRRIAFPAPGQISRKSQSFPAPRSDQKGMWKFSFFPKPVAEKYIKYSPQGGLCMAFQLGKTNVAQTLAWYLFSFFGEKKGLLIVLA